MTDGLPQLFQQHCTVKVSGQGFVLLLRSSVSPSHPSCTLLLYVPNQSRVDTSLTEVRPLADPCPYFPVPADAQRLCENGVSKGESFIRLSTPIEYTLPLCGQYCHKPAP